MMDAKMKRTMKWHTEGYIDTDVVWEVAARKAIKNMDRDSLKRLLNEHFGLWPTQADYMTTHLIWQELQRRNKEEKKMEDKKYYSGSVAVTTWVSRRKFEGDNDCCRTINDSFTFKNGRLKNGYVDQYRMPFDADKRYTKDEICESLKRAWDGGEYEPGQTDISWIFNPDPEGFTGTVDLATVLLKYPKGIRAYADTQVRARCRVRIVDGEFFEKLDGSSKLADILKNHNGAFETKKHIETYIENKWYAGDFGNDASYFTLDIEEES